MRSAMISSPALRRSAISAGRMARRRRSERSFSRASARPAPSATRVRPPHHRAEELDGGDDVDHLENEGHRAPDRDQRRDRAPEGEEGDPHGEGDGADRAGHSPHPPATAAGEAEGDQGVGVKAGVPAEDHGRHRGVGEDLELRRPEAGHQVPPAEEPGGEGPDREADGEVEPHQRPGPEEREEDGHDGVGQEGRGADAEEDAVQADLGRARRAEAGHVQRATRLMRSSHPARPRTGADHGRMGLPLPTPRVHNRPPPDRGPRATRRARVTPSVSWSSFPRGTRRLRPALGRHRGRAHRQVVVVGQEAPGARGHPLPGSGAVAPGPLLQRLPHRCRAQEAQAGPLQLGDQELEAPLPPARPHASSRLSRAAVSSPRSAWTRPISSGASASPGSSAAAASS